MTLYLRLTVFFASLLLPQLALAHSPIQGIGDFLNGMLHPLLVPSQVLIILALGLLYGQHKPTENKLSVLIFLLATISGLVTSGLSAAPDVSLFLLIVATLIGLVIISGVTVPQLIFVILGVVTGYMVGLDSAPENLNTKATVVSLFGSGVGIYFMLLYAMALSETLSIKQWQLIAVRVLASWLSASAIMVLALSFSQ